MNVYTLRRENNDRYLIHDLLFSKEEFNVLCEAAEKSEINNSDYDSDKVCSFLIEHYGFRDIKMND